MKFSISNREGMTLLEVVIALAILGIMSMGLLAMFTSGFTFISFAGNRTAATFDAKSQVEQALNQKNLDAGASGIVITFHDNSTVTAPGKVLQRSKTTNGITENITFFQPTR